MNNPRTQFHVKLSEYPKLEQLFHTDPEFRSTVSKFLYAVDELWFVVRKGENDRLFVDALINGFFAGREKE